MIFRQLYIQRIRTLFGQYMLPDTFDKEIVPLLQVSEGNAFRNLVSSYFPWLTIARAHPNDLVALKNQIDRVLKETAPSNNAFQKPTLGKRSACTRG